MRQARSELRGLKDTSQLSDSSVIHIYKEAYPLRLVIGSGSRECSFRAAAASPAPAAA